MGCGSSSRADSVHTDAGLSLCEAIGWAGAPWAQRGPSRGSRSAAELLPHRIRAHVFSAVSSRLAPIFSRLAGHATRVPIPLGGGDIPDPRNVLSPNVQEGVGPRTGRAGRGATLLAARVPLK
ncbi:hypothetical protein NDU88_004962 [Pleurodeles waltl]|uniref:Uncharacterized protein n=1 Tax=Pleurodeles waltl TaxID=8319 RepID=A0AAV7TTF5_PLEWA|nr:hypothetical protein NDU88_004962 [Pleurodeles waltl]